MSRLKRKRVQTAKKQTGKSLQKPKENSTETRLQERALDIKVGENTRMPKLLTEKMNEKVLLEKVSKEGNKIIARGEFGRVDVPTKNGRIYPKNITQREIDKLQEDLKARKVVGTADHPENGKTSLHDISHVITDLVIKDGIVIGEAEIIPGTRAGKALMALLDADIPVGVSSRGFGSTKTVEEGEEVQEDFVLKTYDFVIDPAMASAVPDIYMEDVDDKSVAEMLAEEFPDAIQHIVSSSAPMTEDSGESVQHIELSSDVSEVFEKKLAEAILAVREDVSAEIRESYDSDPEIGGARAILSQIAEMVGVYTSDPDSVAVRDALKAKDLAIAEARTDKEVAELELDAARKELVLERKVSGHQMAESIRKLVDVKKFDKLEDLEEAVDSLIDQMPGSENSDFISKSEMGLREENMNLQSKVSLLSEEIKGLNSRLLKAVELGERIDHERENEALRANNAEADLSELKESHKEEVSSLKEDIDSARKEAKDTKLELYKRDRVVKLSNGGKLLGLLEHTDSKGAVDEILAKSGGVSAMSDGELEEARRSVRGRDLTSSQMETGAQPLEEGTLDLGIPGLDGTSMSDVMTLIGAGRQQ